MAGAQQGLVRPAWVVADGPSDDVALSTRARLARNVEGIPFPTRAGEADLRRAADTVLQAVRESESKLGKLRVINPSNLSEIDRLALVNARVASREHVDGGKYRPMVLDESGTLSLMVNEEDHLRIQCILPGLQPMAALQTAQKTDTIIGGKIQYAKTDNYGCLTSSLANIGTGLRLSVMLHLSGLTYLEEVVPTLTAAAELKISVRGLFGEGTKAFGDVFQVSNETTIGFTEKEITSRVRAVAEHLISREREARRKLTREKAEELAEEVRLVRNRLTDAGTLSGRDAMAHLSILRLGAETGLCAGVSSKVFRELLVSMQIGAFGDNDRRISDSLSSDVKRAKLVREKLKDLR